MGSQMTDAKLHCQREGQGRTLICPDANSKDDPGVLRVSPGATEAHHLAPAACPQRWHHSANHQKSLRALRGGCCVPQC